MQLQGLPYTNRIRFYVDESIRQERGSFGGVGLSLRHRESTVSQFYSSFSLACHHGRDWHRPFTLEHSSLDKTHCTPASQRQFDSKSQGLRTVSIKMYLVDSTERHCFCWLVVFILHPLGLSRETHVPFTAPWYGNRGHWKMIVQSNKKDSLQNLPRNVWSVKKNQACATTISRPSEH
jgi:hypothetical protein